MKPSLTAARSLITCLMLSALAGAASAQGARPVAETPQSRCAAANREAVAELATALEAARGRNRLNPMLMSRLLAVEAQLETFRAALPRDGRKLKDCELLAQNIAAEQERLARLAGPDPLVADCMAANLAALTQARQALAAQAGLPEAVRATLQARYQALAPVLSHEGQTLQDCKQAATTLADEERQVQAQAAAARAAVEACRADNLAAYGEALLAWRDWASVLGVAAGAQDYDAAMLRLRRLRDELSRSGGSLADCQGLTRAIAQERERAPRPQGAAMSVAQVLAAPPTLARLPARAQAASAPAAPSAAASRPASAAAAAAPAAASAAARAGAAAPAAAPAASAPAAIVEDDDCREPLVKSYNELVQRFARAVQMPRMDEAQREPLRALGERLNALHNGLAATAGTDCPATAKALERATADLQRIPGLPK